MNTRNDSDQPTQADIDEAVRQVFESYSETQLDQAITVLTRALAVARDERDALAAKLPEAERARDAAIALTSRAQMSVFEIDRQLNGRQVPVSYGLTGYDLDEPRPHLTQDETRRLHAALDDARAGAELAGHAESASRMVANRLHRQLDAQTRRISLLEMRIGQGESRRGTVATTTASREGRGRTFLARLLVTERW